MTIVWENASCIGTQEMEGLDGHFFNGKLQYTIFAAGITWAPGLTLPATPISRLYFLCPDMMLFSLFLNYSLYIQCFAFHVLCPKWATARHTGAKSQTFRTLQSYRFCVFITFFFPGFPVFYVADLLGSLYPNGPVCYHLRPSSHTCLNAAAWINPSISMVNGQCEYATRRTHFGHRRWKEICTFVSHAISLTSGKRRRNLQRVHSSDGGIWFPSPMVPNLCIDKKFGFDKPRCAVSFPRIGIGQVDSKQEFFAPSVVHVNLQCAMLISIAVYTHSMTKVSVQLFVRRFGPDRSSDGEFHAIRGTSRCVRAVLQLTDKLSEKGRRVHKVVFVQGTVTTSKTDHCWHASIEIFQPRKYWSCFVLQCPTVCVHSFRDPCAASYFHKRSICILAIFALDSAPKLSRSDRPLSQAYLVAAPHFPALHLRLDYEKLPGAKLTQPNNLDTFSIFSSPRSYLPRTFRYHSLLHNSLSDIGTKLADYMPVRFSPTGHEDWIIPFETAVKMGPRTKGQQRHGAT